LPGEPDVARRRRSEKNDAYLGPVAVRFLGQAPRSRIKELTEIQADVTKAQAVELERTEPAKREIW
jgi:hypothetical protein